VDVLINDMMGKKGDISFREELMKGISELGGVVHSSTTGRLFQNGGCKLKLV